MFNFSVVLLQLIISVRECHCDYWPWALKLSYVAVAHSVPCNLIAPVILLEIYKNYRVPFMCDVLF